MAGLLPETRHFTPPPPARGARQSSCVCPGCSLVSCRPQSTAPTPQEIGAVPSRSRKWRRWPTELPRPVNDNRHPARVAAVKAGWLAVSALLGVALIVVGTVGLIE